jgi:hypothetical protein
VLCETPARLATSRIVTIGATTLPHLQPRTPIPVRTAAHFTPK